MYSPNETDMSEKCLSDIIENIVGEMCLIGGWAVHKLVNEEFEKRTGRNYIGSRDIDIGFHIDENWSEDELETSSFFEFCRILEELGYRWQAFRLFKDYDRNTLEELTPEESARKSSFDILRIFVDPIVDYIHPDIEHIFGYVPIDEPILSIAFKNNLFKKQKLGNTLLFIPETYILLAMKLNSSIIRNKKDKKIKDISDIFALMWYSDMNIALLKEKLFTIFLNEKAIQIVSDYEEQEIYKASDIIGVEGTEIKRVFAEFLKIK